MLLIINIEKLVKDVQYDLGMENLNLLITDIREIR